jgi:hypothetical protein
MAEPKKEAVRIALPHRPETTPGLQNEDAIPRRRSPPTITPPSPVDTGPPIISPHHKTRPAIAQTSPVMVAPSSTIDAFDSIPRWFCWGLLGISTFIFLIQIWNYALS